MGGMNMARWGKSEYEAAWRADSGRLREAATGSGLDRDVPSCPDWTTGDLLGHLSRVYRNIARRMATEAAPPADSRGSDDFEVPTDPVAAFDESVQELVVTLAEVESDTPAWNPVPLPKTAGFWLRRLACETAVHRWDAQMASVGAEPLDGGLAAEGIDEAFDAFLPIGQRREESELSGVAQLFATDLDRHWFVRLREGRFSLLDPHSVDLDTTELHVTASGSASDLYLALWGRVQTGLLDLAGDEGLFKALRIG